MTGFNNLVRIVAIGVLLASNIGSAAPEPSPDKAVDMSQDNAVNNLSDLNLALNMQTSHIRVGRAEGKIALDSDFADVGLDNSDHEVEEALLTRAEAEASRRGRGRGRRRGRGGKCMPKCRRKCRRRGGRRCWRRCRRRCKGWRRGGRRGRFNVRVRSVEEESQMADRTSTAADPEDSEYVQLQNNLFWQLIQT